jgi:alkylhydroperoxidase family enzyme
MSLEFERWLEAMDACTDDECHILALNWRQDPHLSDESKAALGQASESATDHPRSALKTVPDSLWFHPSNACTGDASTHLSRMTHVERFQSISGLTVTKEMGIDDFLADARWPGMIRGS